MQAQVLLGAEVAVEGRVLEDEADVAADVVAGDSTTSKPATVALPLLGCESVQSMLIVVVLPAPLGPRKPKTSPVPTSKLTPRTASNSPKDLRRSVTEIAAGGHWGGRAQRTGQRMTMKTEAARAGNARS